MNKETIFNVAGIEKPWRIVQYLGDSSTVVLTLIRYITAHL